MKIKSILIENFRSFKDQIIIEDLSNVNIFIGPNNAGKSNILEALRYIQQLHQSNQLRTYREMVFDADIKRNIHFTLTFSLSTEERQEFINELFQHHPNNIRPKEILESTFLSVLTYDVVLDKNGLVQEKVTTKNILDGEITIVQNTLDKGRLQSSSLNLLEGCQRLEKVTNIQHNMKDSGSSTPHRWRLLGFNVSAPVDINDKLVLAISNFPTQWQWFEPLRQPSPDMTAGELSKLDSAGSKLVGFLFTLQINDQAERARLKNEIIKTLPQLKEVLTPLSGDKVKLTIGEQGLESQRDLRNVSFGLKQILILICGIMSTEPNSMILIEEPELFLHAGSQRKLFNLIKKEANGKQFFITTHSSIFTGCTDKISTYLVTKKEGVSNVKKIAEPAEMKCIKNELGHRNTDFFSYEVVVFIEGDSEEVAFPIIAEALGYDLVEKGIYLVNVRGKDQFKKIKEYLRYLKDSDVVAYVIADGDKQVSNKLSDWIKEGVLQETCKTVWDLEFEDCFSLFYITKAMNKILKEKNLRSGITIADLEKNRVKGQSVVKALNKLLQERKMPDLNKPELSETLAYILKNEIEKTPANNRKKSQPEKVIEQIVKMVEVRYSEKLSN